MKPEDKKHGTTQIKDSQGTIRLNRESQNPLKRTDTPPIGWQTATKNYSTSPNVQPPIRGTSVRTDPDKQKK